MIELPSKFKLIRVEGSEAFKELELCDRLAELLGEVSEFKALNKFERLLFNPLPSYAGKYANPHHESLAKTPYGYYISNRWSRIDFVFFRRDGGGNRTNLEFEIETKSIPDIIAGLAKKRESLEKRLNSIQEGEVSTYLYIDDKIELNFDRPMTAKQFNKVKAEIIDQLKDLITQVKNLKAGDADGQ